jgi:zinc D-Ala-D-Ala carboxypeptidase
MQFQPSSYGWASGFPLSSVTVTSTGISNSPATSAHSANLSLLSDFLGKLPFPFIVTSGYRSPAVNAAVGGSSTSQHPNGLAVDLSPTGMTNEEAAAWLYANKASFPELDQVIWYTNTTHVHIGICPPGATGCVSGAPRGQFLKTTKESSSVYLPWAPTAAQAASMAAQVAYQTPWTTYLKLYGLWLGVAGVTLGGLWGMKKILDRRRGGGS